jgi:uncharacterized membrane protein YedE/YeeE
MMSIVLLSVSFLFAALCVGVMGFAIQRGATCTVAAVDEFVGKRGYRRLLSLFEASLWVAGGLLVAESLNLLPKMPASYAVSGWTVLGGVLLGLGAYINQACVFGAIARFGSGQWAQIFMPIGFFVGCATLPYVFPLPVRMPLDEPSPTLQASGWLAAAFLAFVAWRLGRPLLAPGVAPGVGGRVREALSTRVWAPHAATIVIGITFFFSVMLAGAWAYTDLLADLSRGKVVNVAVRTVLALALLTGAVWGGWTAGRFKGTRVSASQVFKSLTGGILMGWGTLLIPGSNDGLILVGLPLLRPYAWLAFLTMCVSIGIAMWMTQAMSRRPEIKSA